MEKRDQPPLGGRRVSALCQAGAGRRSIGDGRVGNSHVKGLEIILLTFHGHLDRGIALIDPDDLAEILVLAAHRVARVGRSGDRVHVVGIRELPRHGVADVTEGSVILNRLLEIRRRTLQGILRIVQIEVLERPQIQFVLRAV